MMRRLWRSILTSGDSETPLVAQCDLDEVADLMTDRRIDPQKFAGNLSALASDGIDSLLACVGGEHWHHIAATPTAVKLRTWINRPVGAPLWVLAAFPDVVDWFNRTMQNLSRDGVGEDEKERIIAWLLGIDTNRLAEAGGDREDDGTDVLPARHYRALVRNYVTQTGRALEVAVDEGSEGDIYTGSQLLGVLGQESNFTLIAAATTTYYMELKRSFAAAFPSETSLLAMAGILDACVYIFATRQIEPEQIADLAKATEAECDPLLEFIVRFVALLLSVDTPSISHADVLAACRDQAGAIGRSIQRTIDTYRGDSRIKSDVQNAMVAPEFEAVRRLVGL
jgi:hypothetical protein